MQAHPASFSRSSRSEAVRQKMSISADKGFSKKRKTPAGKGWGFGGRNFERWRFDSGFCNYTTPGSLNWMRSHAATWILAMRRCW